jgi:hypothetical protein
LLRIAGIVPSSYAKETVFLPRGDAPPLKLEIEALPLGEEDVPYTLFPHPEAPEDFKRGGPRNEILRDPKTDRPLLFPNAEDPEYRRRVVVAAQRRAAYVFRRGVRNDASMEFDADRDPGAPAKIDDRVGWEIYCDAVFRDLRDSKLSAGEISRVHDRVLRIGTPTEEQCVEARNRFLRQEGVGTSPNLLLTEPAAPSAT